MKLLLLVFFSILLFASFSQQGFEFSSIYNPIDEYALDVQKACLTNDEGVLLIGERIYESSTLVKFSSYGDVEWSKKYFQDSLNGAKVNFKDVITVSDSSFVVAGSIQDTISSGEVVFCAEIDSLGESLWISSFHLSGQVYNDAIQPNTVEEVVVEKTMDSCLILGWTYLNHPNSTYPDNLSIAKLSNVGDTIWTKTLNFGVDVNINDIKEAPDSSMYIALSGDSLAVILNLSQSGIVNWSKNYGDYYFSDFVFDQGLFYVGYGEDFGKNGVAVFDSIGNNIERKIVFNTGGYSEVSDFNFIRRSQGDFLMNIFADYGGGNQMIHLTDSLTEINSYQVELASREILDIPNKGIFIVGDGDLYGVKVYNKMGLIRSDPDFNFDDCVWADWGGCVDDSLLINDSIVFTTSTPILKLDKAIFSNEVSFVRNFGCVTTTSDIEELTEFDVVVSPNPTTGEFELRWADYRFVDIMIYDMNGRDVLFEHVSGESRNVNLNFCNDGLYFYTVKDLNGNTSRGKVIVSK